MSVLLGVGAQHECAQYTCRPDNDSVRLLLSFHLDTGVRTELRVDGRR